MPIVKDYPTENFVQVHNDTVRDQSLTFEARGVLVYLLSRSASWNPCISDISEQGKLGLNKTKRILAELEAAGYIKKNQARSEGNRFGSVSRTVYGRVYSGPMALEQHESISGDFRAAESRATESVAAESVAAGKSPTKERIQKKDRTKETKKRPTTKVNPLDAVIDDRVDPAGWAKWWDYKGKKLVGKAQVTEVANMLARFTVEQQNNMISYSIIGGYPGLYENQAGKSNGQRNQHKNAGSIERTLSCDF